MCVVQNNLQSAQNIIASTELRCEHGLDTHFVIVYVQGNSLCHWGYQCDICLEHIEISSINKHILNFLVKQLNSGVGYV